LHDFANVLRPCVDARCRQLRGKSVSSSAQANIDFQDFAMIGDAQAMLEDGVLTLRVDLRPNPKSS